VNRWAIIVTGSRRLPDDEARRAMMRAILEEYRGSEQVIVIHGDQVGADKLAERVARELGFDTLPIPYFGDQGRQGGPNRNRCMIEAGLLLNLHGYRLRLHAFPDDESIGTVSCVALARRKHVPCREHPQ
jgi:hypothetical protein